MRNPFFRKLPSCLLGAVIAAGVAGTTTLVRAVDGNPPGLFELDGNIPDDAAKAGDDWGGLYDGSAAKANLIAFSGVLSDPAPKSIFTQGGSKDVNDIPQWKHTDGSVPDKDDITNAYAAAYTNPTDVCITNGAPSACSSGQTPVHKANDLIVYFGFDRYANNGDAFAGFWFFQSDVSLNADGTFNGQHTAMRPDPNNPGQYLPGDMFVTVAYPQASGAVPSIKVYEWDPNDVNGDKNVDPDLSGGKMSPLQLLASAADATCDGKGNKLACAISNLSGQDSPPWPYTPKSGSGLPYESFFEGGINVTRLLGSTPCFASFLAETRSSSSQTAQLKDFVVGAFPVCGIDVTKACAGDLNSTGDGVNVKFFGTLTNTGGSSYVAYLKDSQAGAKIDHVCVDTNTPGCADDSDVSGLVLNASDGSAYFPMTAKMVVRYEGHYTVSGLPPAAPSGQFQLNDIMSAAGFAKAADITDPKLAIVTDTAKAGCNYAVTPKLEVVKDCAVAFLSGDHADVTISGTVKNSGDTPLSSMTLVDSDFGSLTIDGTIAAGVTKNYSKTVTVPYANLSPSVGAPDSNGVVTVTLNHSDKVTASGKVLASDGSTLATAEQSDDATCSTTFTRGIDLQKDCDKVVLEPDSNGKLVVKTKVTVKVTNTGTENLSITSLTDNPAVTFETFDPSLKAGASVTVNGYYYPTSATEISGLYNLKFPDTATVNATGAFSGATATDSDGAECPLCEVPN